MGVAGIVVIGFGVGIEGPSMRLSGFGACAGGNMDALGAWGVGGIWGGAGGRGIRMLRVGGESNVGAVRGARSSPAVVNWSKAVEPKRRVWAVDPRVAEGGRGDVVWDRGGRALGSGGRSSGSSSGSRSLTDRGFW